MFGLFWLQFRALVRKNWIVLSKHPFSTLSRCLILPIAYGLFLSFAQGFLHRLNNYGMGTPQAIGTLDSHFDGKLTLFWVDATTVQTNPTPTEIMASITSNFTQTQLAAVRRVDNTTDIVTSCRQNFNGLSSCFAGISFTDVLLPHPDTNPINYTIIADGGLIFIDVEHHTSDFERQIFPLQWAIDQAIIELRTDRRQLTPNQWPFNTQSNQGQMDKIRLSYVRGIREIIVLAFFLAFCAIVYQTAGSVANERSLLITGHMKAMGLYDSARILSWHISISLTYLPGWIIVSVIWKLRIFVKTGAGLIIFLHVLFGLVLASWSLFVAAPFGKSPQLAAVVTTFSAVAIAVIAQSLDTNNQFGLVWFSIIFPPSFYIFSIKAICGFENSSIPTDAFKGDPDRHLVLLNFVLVAIMDLFLWPCFAVLLERYLYETISPKSLAKSQKEGSAYVPPNVAISIRNLTKTYSTSLFASKGDVTAVSNLNLDIPKTGIFVLLGSNGAGKSTTLSILAGLLSITSGTVTFEGGCARPPRGTMGIVPQKNVLFDDLTCLQTLEVWKAVKWSPNTDEDEDLVQLLIDCDLEKKIHANASTLSGGQKRKLQLAIGLIGGSKLVLVDECTSGVDPLSRRALWKILSAFREDRSIVFTTHLLDEADLLADHIAILAAPGKVLASGSPVALKHNLGEGYSVQVTFEFSLDSGDKATEQGLLQAIRSFAPRTYVTTPSLTQACYHLKTKDNRVVGDVLLYLDAEARAGRIASYDILGTTIEDIFLKLMAQNDRVGQKETLPDDGNDMEDITCDTPLLERASRNGLAMGRPVSPFRQALTIFHKRVLIARRGWLTPFLAVFITVLGACVPLVFIKGKDQPCSVPPRTLTGISLYLPNSPPILANHPLVLASPPGIVNTLGYMNPRNLAILDVADNKTFYSTINTGYHHITTGGVSIDEDTGFSTVAWEATSPGLRGLSMLNLASNILLDRARNETGVEDTTATHKADIIYANYSTFPKVAAATLVYLKWLFFFGGFMAVYPAFFALYVSKERRSSIQAMQLSNGLNNPIGMWLGHLLFDFIPASLLSTIIIIVFSSLSGQFHGLGILWIVFLLYGISGTLFAYCLSLMVGSPLAAFAIVACYQFIVFILYLSSYLAVFTFGKITESSRLTTIIHFTISFVAPITSVIRATLVSTNLFSLLCTSGNDSVTSASMLSITKFGGPILYLIIYIFVLLGILAYVDSGSKVRRSKQKKSYILGSQAGASRPGPDVIGAADAVRTSDDLLRVLNLSKSYDGKRVTDDVSLGVPRDSIFALLGPNGAGKTTTFNIIQGDVYPDSGDVIINGHSIVSHPQRARRSLGVCPQFTAIDSHLTVRDHLMIYGRLKGLTRGPELDASVEMILKSTSLSPYADRLASNLSGGNQRKLALGIALMGNPPVVLIDEFSTGVDPKMKRDMWQTLRKVSVGKAIIITTHSMEEASALANNVGILAKRMLAFGTIDDLSTRYATYEIHFSCRSRRDAIRALNTMSLIPGSRKMDDVATRFEVPIDGSVSLAQLFNKLAAATSQPTGHEGKGEGDGVSQQTLAGEGEGPLEYTVERASLERVFLKVVRQAEDSKRKEGWFQHRTTSTPRTVENNTFVPLRRAPSW